jgi:hypothetical protein
VLLIQPILFKSAIYWVCVFVLRLAESLWHFLRDGGALGDFPNFVVAQISWPRFLAIQIWSYSGRKLRSSRGMK